MRCPYCESDEDKVVDSRLAEEGRAIRRRRECIGCGRRYTTFERAEEVPLLIAKRSGEEEPFERDKVVEGVRRACKNRPVSEAEIIAISEDVEEAMRADSRRPIPSAEIGREVLERLRLIDEVAYLRFASVYKDFQELDDFERELGLLLKKSPPKALGDETTDASEDVS
ncbi:MAG: transcriptional repressor NrdR [Actinobacteria bacterium]|jgi:transcriptional repressor NrdR|nr:transcriptional repressor NrdR [Actinomycetota bacterium]